MVTFTGSTGVGKAIVKAASGTLKKVSLELGGKNPQVIFPDADLDSAVDAVVFGVYFNAGECCNSGSRIIVHEDIARNFVARTVALSRKVPFGDPLDPSTKVGAIITPDHQAKINAYVQDAKASGAEVPIGGDALDVPGLNGQFYQPTVVTNVRSDMRAHTELVAKTRSTLRKAGFPIVLSRLFDGRVPSHQCGTIRMKSIDVTQIRRLS